jgi:hypothetical protein
MADAGTTIRLFVSSTFADFQRERELLQRRVFPEIAQLCRAEGYRFLPIDLRWGVSEDAGSAQRTLPIIFEELARCQRESPEFNFLLLLGDRYGSRLLPTDIPEGTYEQLMPQLDDAAGARLTGAYQLDENAVPPAYVLRPRPSAPTAAEREAAEAAWQEEVARPLLSELAAAAPLAGLSASEALAYTGSVTHLEVQRGLLGQNGPSAALCVVRTFTASPMGATAADYVETTPDGQQGVVTLHAAVGGCLAAYGATHPDLDPNDLTVRYTAGWDAHGPVTDDDALVSELSAVLPRRLRVVITSRQAQARTVHPTNAINMRFAAERIEHFVGREEPLAAIAAYVAAPAAVPLVVAGPGGVGKSTLIAKIVEQAAVAYPDSHVLVRYVGVTLGAESLRTLLDSLRTELADAYGQEAPPVREDYERARAFREALGWATAARPLILVVDALDQLGPPPPPLDWLPETLQPHVHLVVSVLDVPDRPELATLLAREPAPTLVPLGRMDTMEGKALLGAWLGATGRTLQADQQAAVLAAFAEEGRPLYLKLVFEEARRWRSFDRVADLPLLDPTIPGILHARFARLERPDEHGRVLTSHTLGLLRAAKNGLAEDELLALLARDEAVCAEQRALAPLAPAIAPDLPLPAVLWARLYADLVAYLSARDRDGAQLLTFYHRQLAEVAEQRYLQPPEDVARHQALARYFAALTLLAGIHPNLRKLAEQPIQEAMGELTSELRHTLTDVGFLERKIAYQRTDGALDDLTLAPLDDEELRDLAAALRLGAHVLDPEPDQVENQLRGRLSAEDFARLHDLPQRSGPWLCLNSRSLTPVGGPLVRTLAEHTSGVSACAFSPDGRLALSASLDKTLRLWEVTTGQTLHVLQGHTDKVWACAFSPDGQLVLSASRDQTLRLWDVASGQTLHVLLGHTEAVTACAFSPNGQLVLSASHDRTLRLWEVRSGREVARFDADVPLWCCGFSPHGWSVVAGGANAAVHFLTVTGVEDELKSAVPPEGQPAPQPSAPHYVAKPKEVVRRHPWWQFWR